MSKETTFTTVQEVLSYLQRTLAVPKSRENKFGGYKYRNAEDILDAVKAALPAGAVVRVTDEIVLIGSRYYVKATACLKYAGECECCDGYAREAESKKGMDDAQVTGATSSYARKYALCGLFSIDDGQDADAMDNREEGKKQAKPKPEEAAATIVENIAKAVTVDALQTTWKHYQNDIALYKQSDTKAYDKIVAAKDKRKKELDDAFKQQAQSIVKETQERSRVEKAAEKVDNYMAYAAPVEPRDIGAVINDTIPF